MSQNRGASRTYQTQTHYLQNKNEFCRKNLKFTNWLDPETEDFFGIFGSSSVAKHDKFIIYVQDELL